MDLCAFGFFQFASLCSFLPALEANSSCTLHEKSHSGAVRWGAVEACPYEETNLEKIKLDITDSFSYNEEQIKSIYLQLE